jgi:hypothetical protein
MLIGEPTDHLAGGAGEGLAKIEIFIAVDGITFAMPARHCLELDDS